MQVVFFKKYSEYNLHLCFSQKNQGNLISWKPFLPLIFFECYETLSAPSWSDGFLFSRLLAHHAHTCSAAALIPVASQVSAPSLSTFSVISLAFFSDQSHLLFGFIYFLSWLRMYLTECLKKSRLPFPTAALFWSQFQVKEELDGWAGDGKRASVPSGPCISLGLPQGSRLQKPLMIKGQPWLLPLLQGGQMQTRVSHHFLALGSAGWSTWKLCARGVHGPFSIFLHAHLPQQFIF